MTKAPTPTEMSKGKWQHKQRHKKVRLNSGLRTDLGWSVGVTTATQLVWLTWFTGPNLPTPRNSRVFIVKINWEINSFFQLRKVHTNTTSSRDWTRTQPCTVAARTEKWIILTDRSSIIWTFYIASCKQKTKGYNGNELSMESPNKIFALDQSLPSFQRK